MGGSPVRHVEWWPTTAGAPSFNRLQPQPQCPEITGLRHANAISRQCPSPQPTPGNARTLIAQAPVTSRAHLASATRVMPGTVALAGRISC
jgi:hypothetical protein